MTQILLAYLAWGPAVLGFGAVLLLLAPEGTGDPDPASFIVLMVAGFAALCSVATTLNFFTPLSPSVDLSLLVAGWILLVVRIRFVSRMVARSWSGPILGWFLLAASALAWAAYPWSDLAIERDGAGAFRMFRPR